jgi:hypothetical protein
MCGVTVFLRKVVCITPFEKVICKEVIRSRISKKVRQHNEQKTKDKGQITIYITQKTNH